MVHSSICGWGQEDQKFKNILGYMVKLGGGRGPGTLFLSADTCHTYHEQVVQGMPLLSLVASKPSDLRLGASLLASGGVHMPEPQPLACL